MKQWENRMEKEHPVLLEMLKGVAALAMCGLVVLAAVIVWAVM